MSAENELKDKFLVEQVWMLAWAASVQRANLYVKDADEKLKGEFRKNLIEFVQNEIIKKYVDNEVVEDQHYEHIKLIIAHAEEFAKNYKSVLLKGDKYKAGIAQKLLNLALKYYWCLNKIKKPPHCPIDRIILIELKIDDIAWTQIETVNEYKEVIERVKSKLGRKDLSAWELEVYERAQYRLKLNRTHHER